MGGANLPLQRALRGAPASLFAGAARGARPLRHHRAAPGAAAHEGTFAARAVLQDWNDGAIKYFTQPPREAAEVRAQLVEARQAVQPRSRAACTFYLAGHCRKGAKCEFSHEGQPSRKAELCKFG